MKKILSLFLFLVPFVLSNAQETNNVRYSAVNPALFLYQDGDVFINPPQKYNNGNHLVSPSPVAYPWEAHLENGMPNVFVDPNKNVSVYISSFLIYNPSGGSKVGAMVYTNNSNNLEKWDRPNAGLYWYKASGATPDEKISSTYVSGSVATNIVAADIESLSFLEETINGTKKVRAVYSPQRQSVSNLLAVYDMDRTFNTIGVLNGFNSMKQDRLQKQKMLHYRFTNGGTHLNLFKQHGKYYLNGRVNTRRTYLQSGEVPPFNPDPRKRFRRSTVSELGNNVASGEYDYYTALDMSTTEWEPYSIQSFKLPGYEDDIQWGLITMYGTDGIESLEMKQRTELAFTVDGMHWKYLKSGTPFLDNGTDPNSDDYGCINIAKPVWGTKFYSDPRKLLYFYASSNHRHVITRQTGISLATGIFGKLAGLYAGNQVKSFTSMSPQNNALVETADMIHFYVGKAFGLGKEFCPYILADITEDPRGKLIQDLGSYVALSIYEYDAQASEGKGKRLGAVLGSSLKGTTLVSDDFESVPIVSSGKDMTDKSVILDYIRDYSKKHPNQIIDFNTMAPIPVLLEVSVKNATFYGIEFKNQSENRDVAVDLTQTSNFDKQNLWEYKPTSPQKGTCQSFDFSNEKKLPNMSLPVDMSNGAFAFKVTPESSKSDQVIFKMSGDNNNYLSLIYTSGGKYQYEMVKDGIPFNKLEIAPPLGKSFAGKTSTITLEGTPCRDRKYLKNYTEDVTVMRVNVPSMSFEETVHEPITWNWKHQTGQITQSDTAVARAFAYVPFTSFVAGMTKINVGGNSDSCDKNFLGLIEQIEVSDGLPSGDKDFWSVPTTRNILANINENSVEASELSIFPNPVKRGELLTIRINSSSEEPVELHIYDLLGRDVYHQIYEISQGINNFTCETSGLSLGIHLLTVKLGSKVLTKKIMIIN